MSNYFFQYMFYFIANKNVYNSNNPAMVISITEIQLKKVKE